VRRTPKRQKCEKRQRSDNPVGSGSKRFESLLSAFYPTLPRIHLGERENDVRKAVLTLLIAVLVAASAPAAALDPPIISWEPPSSYTPAGSRSGRTALTDLTGPLPFIPITACRQYNSQGPPPNPLLQNTTRQLTLSGAPCGIPTSATAIALNITIFNILGATANGVFSIGNTSSPTTAWINYPPTEVQRGNAGVVSAAASATIWVKVNQSGSGSVDFVVDVFGYYATSPANQNNSFSVSNSAGSATIQATNLSTTCTGPCGMSATVSSGIAVAGSSATGGDGVYGTSADASAPGVHGFLNQPFSGSPAVLGEHKSTTGLVYGVLGTAVSPSGYGVWFTGNFGGTGTKSFVEPHPTDPTLVVNYVALEGPEAGTYFRGTARTVRQEAVIQVPEDFRIVTAEEGLTVQLTPVGELTTMAVVRENLNEIHVRSLRDVRFHYLVQGVRKAYRNHQPIAATLEYMPRSAEDRMPEGLSEEAKQRLIANGSYNPDGTVNMDTAQRVGWTKIWEEQKAPAAKAAPPAHTAEANPDVRNGHRPIVEALPGSSTEDQIAGASSK